MASKFRSILGLKCPRCFKGKLFSEPNFFKLSKLGEMPDKCEVCGQRFQLEPGFYFGAAWMSYTLNVLMILIAAPLLYIYAGLKEPLTLIVVVISLLLLITPWTFRVSRAIWIHLFVKFDPNWGTANE
jgi:uncharacterized protein (DUF983 family)